MECTHCGAEWSIMGIEENTDFIYPGKCPFCGCSRMDFIQDSASVLRQIVENNGVDILNNRRKLSGYISDLMCNHSKEQILLKIVVMEGIGEIFYDMLDTDETSINTQKRRAIKLLTEDIGLTQDRVDFIISVFMYAIGLNDDLEVSHNKVRNYRDQDNTYLNLAEKYWNYNEKNLAKEFFIVSSNTGNIMAIRKTIKLARKYNWETDEEEWLRWNKLLADSDKTAKEAAYIVAMNYTYGISTERNIEKAEIYWKIGKNYNAESHLVYYINQLLGILSCPHTSSYFHTIMDAFEKYANASNEMALSACEFFEDNFDIDWEMEFIYPSGTLNNSFEQIERAKKYELAILLGDYFAKKMAELENKHWDLEYEYLMLICYIIATSSDNMEITFKAAKRMLDADWYVSKKQGIKILEKLINVSEAWGVADKASYIVGVEYLNGDVIEQNFDTAFKYISNGRDNDYKYMMGQMMYYGWGTKGDILSAIKYFESYIMDYRNGKLELVADDQYVVIQCVPFLIQCYYEDLVINDSVQSLDKLKLLADYHGWKFAAKYLYWYYSDLDNLFQDDIDADHYKKIAVDKGAALVNFDEYHCQELAMVVWECNGELDDNISVVDAKNHLLLVDDIFLNDKLKTCDMLFNTNIRYKVFYYFARNFAYGKGVARNKLRAENYIRLFLENIDVDKDTSLYYDAMSLYSSLLLEYPESSHKFALGNYYKNMNKDDL